MDEDLLVLLEPPAHGVPLEADQLAQLVDRRLRVVPGSVLDLAVAALHGEVVGVATTRRTSCVPVRSQQFHAYVLPREVIRGIVRDLPYQLEALRVGDELSAEVGSYPFGPILDMNTISGIRHGI